MVRGDAQPTGRAFRADCRQTLEMLDAWPSEAWPALRQACEGPAPVLLVGEGSSRLFPGSWAAHLARHVGLAGRVDACGGREAAALPLSGVTLCFASNSGATRELVELAEATGDHPRRLALLGVGGGPLTRLVPEHRTVLLRPEGAVAATVSVVGQALHLAQAVAETAGHVLPVAALREAVAQVLDLPLPESVASALGRTERVWWCDGGSGVGAELALKTMELPGLPGLHAPGTLILHGLEEVLGPQDLVVVADLPQEDRPLLRRGVGDGAGARILYLDGPDAWPLPEVGLLQPLVQLVAGWRLLEALTHARGRDPDRPRRARKVGNPAV